MFEAYKVAVKLTLISNVAQQLTATSALFGKLEKSVTSLQLKLNQLKKIALFSGMAAGVGFLGIKGLKDFLKPAEDYTHQLALMNQQGMKHADVVNSIATAWKTARDVQTSTASGNLETIRHLRMVFGGSTPEKMHEALEFLPTIQKAQAILKTFSGRSVDESYEMAKALELRGAVKDTNMFQQQADMMLKASVASGGKVNMSDFLGTFKYLRQTAPVFSNDFMYTILPTLIQEMKNRTGVGGSGGPGNAIASLYSNVVGGTMTMRSIQFGEKIGLIDPSKVIHTKGFGTRGVGIGGIAGSDLFMDNPFQWVQQVLLPDLMKSGYNTPKQLNQAIQQLFQNRTSAFIISQFALQQWKFLRDQDLIKQATGIGGFSQLINSDPNMAMSAFNAQWTNFKIAFAQGVIPILIPAIRDLTNLLNDWAEWAQAHPNVAKKIIEAFAVASAALMTFGTLLGVATVVAIFRANAALTALNATLAETAAVSGAGGAATAAKAGGIGALAAKAGRFGAYGLLAYAAYALVSKSYQGGLDQYGHKTLHDIINSPTNDKNRVNAAHEAENKIIQLVVDGRVLAQSVVKYLEKSMYHATIASKNNFNSSQSPSVVGTGSSF